MPELPFPRLAAVNTDLLVVRLVQWVFKDFSQNSHAQANGIRSQGSKGCPMSCIRSLLLRLLAIV